MSNVTFTDNIPICPDCKVPTKRTYGGSSTTSMYFQPVYDENGVNTNPDRNTITSGYKCECGKYYCITGNSADGFNYK